MLSPQIGRRSQIPPQAPPLPGPDARERGLASVDEFLARLGEACARGVRPDRVTRVLSEWRPNLDSLLPWIAFRPDRYTRQRLFRGPAYEVLLMCWDREQDTPIHDHDGQSGWIRVIAGSLYIQDYTRQGGPKDLKDLRAGEETPPGSVPLACGSRRVVPAGSIVAEAEAPEVIHRVGPVNGRALSIHVYAGPVDTFLAFDEIRGTARRAALSPDSK